MREIRFTQYANAGELAKERVVFRAYEDLLIGDYAVFASPINNKGEVLSGTQAAFWFPDDDISNGDLVVLYTKTGTAKQKDLTAGRRAHFYYWGLNEPQWASGKNSAVLVEVSGWEHSPPPSFSGFGETDE
ncbi:hypothetical protein [Stenotrophomonas sp. TWI1183]|uniref:hypothetical protein n=1 Tax=Stenotrophomonas sp. TWI1183 TaxID=3136799 RepID=UPI00320832C8